MFSPRWHRHFVLICLLLATGITSGVAHESGKPDIPRFLSGDSTAVPAKKPDRIRFITSNDFPPFNFVDGTGRLTGYNVELARAICTRLAIRCTIQVRPFPLLLKTVQENRADAVIAGLRDSATLRQYLDYTRPYLRLPARFVMKRKSAVDAVPETLDGLTVAVQGKSRYAQFLKDFFPKSRLAETTSDAESFGRVKTGEADAAFGSALSASFWMVGPDAADCCVFAGGAYTEPAYFGAGLSIAVAKDNDELRETLNDTLHGLEVDGITAELYARFFPVSLY